VKRAAVVLAFVFASVLYLGCAADTGGDVRSVTAPGVTGAAPHTPVELAAATGAAWRVLEDLRWPRQTVTLTPPEVIWVQPADLNCGNATGYLGDDGVCYAGMFGGWTARVSLPAGATIAGDGILAHELCHAIVSVDSGDGDPDHTGVCFQSGGWVEQANAAIAAAMP
jgi:hypothetical protein